MGYFGYLAQQAFKSTPDGQRLFYRGGPWSRPYLVPDAETEQRLFRKQRWLMRGVMGALIVGQPFLYLLVPDVVHEPLWFAGYLAIMTSVFSIVGRIMFRGDVARLSRLDARMPLRDFYADTAARHSTKFLVGMLILSVIFVLGGIGIVVSGQPGTFVGWACIVFFGLCAGVFVYAMWLKSERPAATGDRATPLST